MGLFKKGYESVREEKQRQEDIREKSGKRLWRFFLGEDGEEADVRFLTEEPINFYEHTIKITKGGKEKYDTTICTREIGDCPLCDNGDKPSFKGAYLVYDMRPYEYTDKDGKKKKGKGQLKLYVQGTRVLSQLDRLSERYGLTNRTYTITRTGSGTSTTYMFDRGDEEGKLSDSEIKNMLPEKLRDSFDGTMESLYTIVKEQLEMMLSNSSDASNNDNDTDDEEDGSSNFVNIDDEEDSKPTIESSKTGKIKSKLGRKLSPKENSVKAIFKKK